MAEIIVAIFGLFVTPVIEIGKIIAAPIKVRLNYLRSFDSNKKSLTEEAEKLKIQMDSLQRRVDAANTNIRSDVIAWLDDSRSNQEKTSGIEDELRRAPSGCLAIKSRYSLSKKAKKTADAMKDLRERGTFPEISVPAPPASMAPPTPQGPSDHEFPSRKQIEEKIMEDLRGGNINMMGICGMGGVGKTTMAKRIMNKVREEKLFHEVVMAVVSQRVDQWKIQGEIAEWLGLELKEDSVSARAHKLRFRLTGGKSILLILDDVWVGLNLEELGIPSKSDAGGGCTIVLTSRNDDVLNEMDAKPYAMKILSKEEAWSLFNKKVGTCLDDPDLISIAKEVAEECNGLPLALTIVGTTLKKKKEKYVWEDALHQLKTANPEAMPDFLEGVYKPLKLSYVYLKNQQAGSLFLLCCIFPEDHNIHLEYLTMYGIGLHMFEGMSLEEARNRVCTLCKMLKGRFLLLDGRDKNHVKMHDVVRDVGTFIASEEGRVDRNLSLKHSSREESVNCTWISVIGEQINKLPIDLSFPSLRLLSMNNSPDVPEISIIPSFFQGMKELNVLSFSYISCRSLPETTKLLKNLRTLYLNRCSSLETISIVGELLSLEILICRNCDKIAEFPVEIRRLKQLKLLEVSKCKNLKRIAPEVISKLVQLEELIIVGSFVGWERKTNGKQRVNATLCELEHLKNLTRLDIEIEDVSLVSEEMCFSTKIVNYHISFMSESSHQHESYMFHHESGMDLVLGKDIILARWIHVFLRSTHSLSAIGDGSNSLDLAQVQNLKKLVYKDCSTMNKLVNITKASNSFENLKELSLFNCPKLSKLFPLSMAKDGLLLLEKLNIEKCEMMEEVFSNEENEKDGDQCHMITFPKLKELELLSLPNLRTFCKGSDSIKFPLLNKISIERCGNLKSLISGSCNNLNLEGHDADSFYLFCNQKVSFGCLKEIFIWSYDISNMWCHQIPVGFFSQLVILRIASCNVIRNLFSSSIARNLVNLKELEIWNCYEMVKVIEDIDEEMLAADQNPHCILFPSLKKLRLQYLLKLQSFCNWRCDLQLPSLERVWIIYCPLLELESVIFGNLKQIRIWGCNCKFIFSSSIAKKLVNLEELIIGGCNEMVKVIEDIDEEMLTADQNPHCILFPSLNTLSLWFLPKLQSFCNWRCDLQLPSLERVKINNCPLLEFFTMGSVSTPNLKILKTDDYRDKDVGDLNSAIQQVHFETNQHQPISTPKETSTSDDKQAGAEEDHQKSEIQELEQINEGSKILCDFAPALKI